MKLVFQKNIKLFKKWRWNFKQNEDPHFLKMKIVFFKNEYQTFWKMKINLNKQYFCCFVNIKLWKIEDQSFFKSQDLISKTARRGNFEHNMKITLFTKNKIKLFQTKKTAWQKRSNSFLLYVKPFGILEIKPFKHEYQAV